MEIVEISRTIKSRIIFQDSNDISKMIDSQEAFRHGCNFVSEYMFDNNFPMNTTTLVKLLYHDLREKFRLKSQMAQSCVRRCEPFGCRVTSKTCVYRYFNVHNKSSFLCIKNKELKKSSFISVTPSVRNLR